jgi:hypothetical protein
MQHLYSTKFALNCTKTKLVRSGSALRIPFLESSFSIALEGFGYEPNVVCIQLTESLELDIQVDDDATLIMPAMDTKILQPDERSLRDDSPTVRYASLAATSNPSSTQRIDSSRETEIWVCPC